MARSKTSLHSLPDTPRAPHTTPWLARLVSPVPGQRFGIYRIDETSPTTYMTFPFQAPGVGVRAVGDHSELDHFITATSESGHLNEGVTSAVSSMLVTVLAASVNISIITYRCTLIQNWWRVPWTMWLVLGIHVNTWTFFTTCAILRYLISYNKYEFSCARAYNMCIISFTLTKFMSLFLVERAHIVLSQGTPRLKSKLYVLNMAAVICIYTICFTLFWPFHTTTVLEALCMVGVRRFVLLLNITGDGALNIYLTTLFLLPLLRSHSLHNRRMPWYPPSEISAGLRELALRTFIGSVVTLVSISVNVLSYTILRVEPLWLCMVSCEADLLVTTIMVHWIAPGERPTKSDKRITQPSDGSTPQNMNAATLERV